MTQTVEPVLNHGELDREARKQMYVHSQCSLLALGMHTPSPCRLFCCTLCMNHASFRQRSACTPPPPFCMWSPRPASPRRFGIDSVDSLAWRKWVPGVEYVKSLVLKNVSNKQVKFQYKAPGSKAFGVEFPEPVKLMPGMSYALKVRRCHLLLLGHHGCAAGVGAEAAHGSVMLRRWCSGPSRLKTTMTTSRLCATTSRSCSQLRPPSRWATSRYAAPPSYHLLSWPAFG